MIQCDLPQIPIAGTHNPKVAGSNPAPATKNPLISCEIRGFSLLLLTFSHGQFFTFPQDPCADPYGEMSGQFPAASDRMLLILILSFSGPVIWLESASVPLRTGTDLCAAPPVWQSFRKMDLNCLAPFVALLNNPSKMRFKAI